MQSIKLLGCAPLQRRTSEKNEQTNEKNEQINWFVHSAHTIDPDYPAVESHAIINQVLQMPYRRQITGGLFVVPVLIDVPCE
jgi:hypothetical protein